MTGGTHDVNCRIERMENDPKKFSKTPAMGMKGWFPLKGTQEI